MLVSVHRCLPFVVLLLANALADIDDEVLQCASAVRRGRRRACFARSCCRSACLESSPAQSWRFSLTAAGFVIPRLVGGAVGGRFRPVLMYQQITVMQNWRFGAAIGVVLLAASLLTVAAGAVRAIGQGRTSAQ